MKRKKPQQQQQQQFKQDCLDDFLLNASQTLESADPNDVDFQPPLNLQMLPLVSPLTTPEEWYTRRQESHNNALKLMKQCPLPTQLPSISPSTLQMPVTSSLFLRTLPAYVPRKHEPIDEMRQQQVSSFLFGQSLVLPPCPIYAELPLTGPPYFSKQVYPNRKRAEKRPKKMKKRLSPEEDNNELDDLDDDDQIIHEEKEEEYIEEQRTKMNKSRSRQQQKEQRKTTELDDNNFSSKHPIHIQREAAELLLSLDQRK